MIGETPRRRRRRRIIIRVDLLIVIGKTEKPC
jgi:hypothetical protein